MCRFYKETKAPTIFFLVIRVAVPLECVPACSSSVERLFLELPSFCCCYKFKLFSIVFRSDDRVLPRILAVSSIDSIHESRRRNIQLRRRIMNELEETLHPTLTTRTVSQRSNANLAKRRVRHHHRRLLLPVAFHDTEDRWENKIAPSRHGSSKGSTPIGRWSMRPRISIRDNRMVRLGSSLSRSYFRSRSAVVELLVSVGVTIHNTRGLAAVGVA